MNTTAEQEEAAAEEISPLEVRFTPPAHLQRRRFIYAHLCKHAPKTLLDIGTGEGALLAHLVTCDDQVPIETLHGFDVDTEAMATIRIDTDDQDLRWRPLDISVFHGGIQQLGPPLNKTYDAIAAIEVLEHLDPPDVAALGQTLRKLAPRLFYVSTPNRDFNTVFERIGQPPTFRRPDVPYAMRHDDHRFELSRAEFQQWANSIATGLPYKVSFHGIGLVANAFADQAWQDFFPEDTEAVFGCSTQLAIFERTADLEPQLGTQLVEPMLLTQHIVLPFSTEDGFPPTKEAMKRLVLEGSLYFTPIYEEDGLIQPTYSIVDVPLARLFQVSYPIQRICRFSESVFAAVMAEMVGIECSGEEHGTLSSARVDPECVCYVFDVREAVEAQEGKQEEQEEEEMADGQVARWLNQNTTPQDQYRQDQDDWEA